MFKNLLELQRRLPPLPQVPLSQPVKLTAFTVSLGFALIGILAVFFRRRKRRRPVHKPAKPTNKQKSGSAYYQRFTKVSSPNGGRTLVLFICLSVCLFI